MKKSLLSSLLLIPLLMVSCNKEEPGESKYKSISILDNPDKLTYVVGEYFDPTGLTIKLIDKDDKQITVDYAGNENQFTFSPSLTTKLDLDDSKVVATYESLSVDIDITVEEDLGESTVIDFAHRFNDSEKVEDPENPGKLLSTTMNTDELEKFKRSLNVYYIDQDKITLNEFSGVYAQITRFARKSTDYSKDQDTPSADSKKGPQPQTLLVTSKTHDCDLTMTFSKTIKAVKFTVEGYVKYNHYLTEYSVDYDTSLTINGTSRAVTAHTESDNDESVTLTYSNINSASINIKVPNDYIEVGEAPFQRLLIHSMELFF